MDQERTYKWIQERLRDLQSGRITEADRLRLDELAKTDPFLADALAGFRAHPHIDHSERLHTIAHKVRFRREVKRKWLMPAVAASLLVVAGIWTLVDLTSREKTEFVASNQPAPSVYNETTRDLRADERTEEDIATVEALEDASSSPSGLRAHAQSKLEANRSSSQQEDGVMLSDTKKESANDYAVAEPVTSPPPAFDREMKQDVAAGSGSSSVVQSGTVTEAARNQASDEGLYANQMDPAEMRKRVTGQVLNLVGEPLMSAMVSVTSTNLITATDQYGRFEVFLPVRSAGIDIHLPGFKDTTFHVTQGSQDLVIMLKEDASFAQVNKMYAKTDALSHSRAEAGSVSSSYNQRKNFMDYIRQHSSFPVADEYSPGSKAVRMEFYINANHRPERIKVMASSGSKKHDEEAIKLLKEGPNWVCDDDVYPCLKEFIIFFK